MKQTSLSSRQLGKLLILLASVGFGTMPAISQLGFRSGLSVQTILAFRFSGAAVIIWLYMLRQKIDLRIPWALRLRLFGVGLMITIAGLLLTSSYVYLPGLIATLGMFSYVILVMLMELVLGRETLQWSRLLSLGLAVVGLILVVWDPSGELSFHPLGLVLAFGAALFNALHIVGLGSHSLKGLTAEVTLAWLILPAVVLHNLRALITGHPLLPGSPEQWFFALYLAIFVSALSGIFFFKGLKLVGGTNAALLNMSEPAIAYLAGVLLMGDRIELRALLGGTLIIFAMILLNGFDQWKARRLSKS